jgi:5-methylcytosine-specific restriction endonuclease McrA
MRRNPDKARAAMRRWRERHPDERKAEKRAYYARHQERLNAEQKEYLRLHPEVRQTSWELRRARVINASGSYTTREWRELLEFCGHRCAYCAAGGPLQVDHATPLFRGGCNYIENIRPACRSCNMRKHKLTEDEYRERRAKEGLYVRPRLRRVPGFEETSGSFSASAMSREG